MHRLSWSFARSSHIFSSPLNALWASFTLRCCPWLPMTSRHYCHHRRAKRHANTDQRSNIKYFTNKATKLESNTLKGHIRQLLNVSEIKLCNSNYSKWVWPGNATISHCRPTHGTVRKRHRIQIPTPQQKTTLKSKAAGSLFFDEVKGTVKDEDQTQNSQNQWEKLVVFGLLGELYSIRFEGLLPYCNPKW